MHTSFKCCATTWSIFSDGQREKYLAKIHTLTQSIMDMALWLHPPHLSSPISYLLSPISHRLSSISYLLPPTSYFLTRKPAGVCCGICAPAVITTVTCAGVAIVGAIGAIGAIKRKMKNNIQSRVGTKKGTGTGTGTGMGMRMGTGMGMGPTRRRGSIFLQFRF